jgi:thioredoxin-related protein
MIKTLTKVLTGLLFAALFLLSGCDEKTSVKTVKQETPKLVKPIEKKVDTNKVEKVAKNSIPKVDNSDIFKDTFSLTPNGKYMIVIFETDKCPYCAKMNLDIHNDKKLHDTLKNDFSVYSLDAMKNRMHKIEHEGKPMDVDTKTLIDIYSVNSTPTLIFMDKKGKRIFIVPGYMPPKQFKVTLDFVKSGLWLGKDRKNGEVYKALKEFYEKNGIMVGKKKKS